MILCGGVVFCLDGIHAVNIKNDDLSTSTYHAVQLKKSKGTKPLGLKFIYYELRHGLCISVHALLQSDKITGPSSRVPRGQPF